MSGMLTPSGDGEHIAKAGIVGTLLSTSDWVKG